MKNLSSRLASRPAEIANLDPSIFQLESSTSQHDKQSLLRVQRLAGELKEQFSYLEIGSYRGGTLLPYIRDPQCEYIVSIDKRPDFQPDERALNFFYRGITTASMVKALTEHVSETDLAKLETFDADAVDVPKGQIVKRIDAVLIDGEHTNIATASDFLEIFPMLADDALVAFHDVNLISDALQIISLLLKAQGIIHSVTILPDVVGVIALRAAVEPAHKAFSAAAIETTAFIKKSKQVLREQIAASVAQGLHIGVA